VAMGVGLGLGELDPTLTPLLPGGSSLRGQPPINKGSATTKPSAIRRRASQRLFLIIL
jgi:hypothetical protein